MNRSSPELFVYRGKISAINNGEVILDLRNDYKKVECPVDARVFACQIRIGKRIRYIIYKENGEFKARVNSLRTHRDRDRHPISKLDGL